MQYHKYSLNDLESLIPWERDIYLAQLIEYIEVENEKIRISHVEEHRKSSNVGFPY